jgi:S-adenosylmethionine synthetase
MSVPVARENLAYLLKNDLERWWSHSACTVGLAYQVGELDPCGVVLHFHGTGQTFTLRIIEGLDDGLLLRPELPFPTREG